MAAVEPRAYDDGMVAMGRLRAVRERSEEASAAVGVVLAVSISCAVMTAITQLFADELPVVAAPGAVLAVAMLVRHEILALWAAAAVWAVIVPLAPGIGVLAPMLMAGSSASLAIGPDRVVDWAARDWTSHRPDEVEQAGWIEDDPRVQ